MSVNLVSNFAGEVGQEFKEMFDCQQNLPLMMASETQSPLPAMMAKSAIGYMGKAVHVHVEGLLLF